MATTRLLPPKMTSMSSPDQVDLDTLPVDHDYLTAVLTEERLAVSEALRHVRQQRDMYFQRLAQIDEALALRATEMDVIEAYKLANDIHGA